MGPAWLGAAGQVGGSLVGALANIGQSRRANKRMVDFWNMQNEYNHPRAQMQRLQEAGLNPNLVYGGGPSGASGKAEGVGTPDKPDLSGVGNLFGDVMNVFKTIAETNRTKAQADLVREQVTTEMEQRRILPILRSDKEHDIALKGQRFNTTAEMFPHQLQATKLSNQFAAQSMPSRVRDIAMRVENAKANLEGRQLNNELLQLQKSFLRLGLDRNSPWYAKIFGAVVNKATQK